MEMNRRSFLRTAAAAAATPGSRKWNILFILIDDLGWHDTAPYGNTFIDTPNLNRLAAESAVFTNAYAACPVCSPTRASILTGQYPARLHLTDWIPGRKQWPYAKLLTPAFEQQLPRTAQTIAEMVGPNGYRTAAIGKWHLGGKGSLPTDRGFDVNIGGTDAGHPPRYFGPLDLPGLTLKPGEFLTQRLTSDGSHFMRESHSAPFFLYQSQFTVHMPLQAPEQLTAKYRGRNTGDVDATYCAMVETVDDCVGQMLKALDESGKAKDTIVVFFSDNGGVRFQERRQKPVTNNAPLRAGKGHLYEGGIREPLMIRWPGVSRAGSRIDQPVSSVDFAPTFCDALGIQGPKMDGVSLRRTLRGERTPERPLFWHYPHYSDQGGKPGGAVRLSSWKLIEFYEDGRLELYNLRSDPGEARNLIDVETTRARRMREMLAIWRNDTGASMPRVNPQYDPARASEALTGYERAGG